MGAVASPPLAGAVARAGGLGTLTALGRTTEQLLEALDLIGEPGPGAVAVNFLTEMMDREAIVAVAGRVRVVDFFWAGPDAALVELAHQGGALASWQVGSVDDARAAADAGCDLLVAQGVEAGGHVAGRVPLLPLLDGILSAVSIPVLASGGIGSARAVAAVLAAGAAGVRIGTRFAAAVESGAHDGYKQALVSARAGETEITDQFSVMCPLCAQLPRARVLSSTLAAAHGLEGDTVGEAQMGDRWLPLPKFAGLPPHTGVTGHVEAMALYAGESVGAVTGVIPAADIVRELSDGAGKLLAAW